MDGLCHGGVNDRWRTALRRWFDVWLYARCLPRGRLFRGRSFLAHLQIDRRAILPRRRRRRRFGRQAISQRETQHRERENCH
jgi:hypothetical protein